MQNKFYPVHERFAAFQGEGFHMGRSAFFIRLFGCPLHCPWCDSAGTWHPGHVPRSVDRVAAHVLAQEALESRADFVVITGGEPCIHDLVPLVIALHKEQLDVHLETSGAFGLQGARFNWVTCSPKIGKLPVPDVYNNANELKIIVENPESIEQWATTLSPYRKTLNQFNGLVWLHPEWSKREDRGVLNAICDAVAERPRWYRAGWQLHKLYRVDTLDTRSRAPVPLGGNPALGY